jgi:hypothetical protein
VRLTGQITANRDFGHIISVPSPRYIFEEQNCGQSQDNACQRAHNKKDD